MRLAPILGLFALAAAAGAQADIGVTYQFFTEHAVTLEELAAGTVGSGHIAYYLEERGVEQPSLVVRLSRPSQDMAIAEVFDAPEGSTSVPVDLTGASFRLVDGLRPRLTVHALGGWWVRDDRVNWNLDIEVRGHVRGTMNAIALYPHYSDHEILVQISVRADDTGLPKWDLRTLVPELPRQGRVRVSYSERECQYALTTNHGVSPSWPYVDGLRGFYQRHGSLEPPITVDWSQGKVTGFSEVVSVRNQPCSYSFYSIGSLVPGELNRPNFETPFAFYDLSASGNLYPNLILRTERFSAADPWSASIDPAVMGGTALPFDVQWLRYSWRNDVGDQFWDYKIGALGRHPFTSTTEIAGGEYVIDAPSYGEFPTWVVEHDWPVVTFVDTNGASYRSSEGIYEWSPRRVGTAYFVGWDTEPRLEPFTSIRTGFRGEYRVGEPSPASLYMSPIDNLLHLHGAQGGVWNLDDRWEVHLENLSGDEYIDSWSLVDTRAERDTPAPPEESLIADRHNISLVQEQLVALGDYLLHVTEDRVVLRQSHYVPALFSLPPPSDNETWLGFRERLAPFESTARDPSDLASWLDAFPGPTLTFDDARIRDLRSSESGFRFTLLLLESSRIAGDLGVEALSGLSGGAFVVSFVRSTASWTVDPLQAIDMLERIVSDDPHALMPSRIELHISNLANRDVRGPASLRIGDMIVNEWPNLLIPGGGLVVEQVPWTPERPGVFVAALDIGGETWDIGEVVVQSGRRIGGWRAFDLAGNGVRALVLGFVTASLVGLGVTWMLRRP